MPSRMKLNGRITTIGENNYQFPVRQFLGEMSSLFSITINVVEIGVFNHLQILPGLMK